MSTLDIGVKRYFEDLNNGCNNLINCDQLNKLIDGKEDIFMLDIRRKPDYDAGHIKGSFHSEWNEIGELIEEDVFNKDQLNVIICYSGQTAGQVVGVLRTLGYKACSLLGGMNNGWVDKGQLEAACGT